jgi:hypothetical protein
MQLIHKSELFTSDLSIFIGDEDKIDIDELNKRIEYHSNYIQEFSPYSRNDKFCTTSGVHNKYARMEVLMDSIIYNELSMHGLTDDHLSTIVNYNAPERIDLTSVLKGLFMSRITSYFMSKNIRSYIINFGGDIVGKNADKITYSLTNSISPYLIDLSGTYSLFVSGNDEKRGKHIRSNNGTPTADYAIILTKCINPVLCDFYATQCVADINYEVPSYIEVVRIVNNKLL